MLRQNYFLRVVVLPLVVVAACSSDAPSAAISSAIEQQFVKSNGTLVDLALAAPGKWERVCVLGPYTNNDLAKQVLGFEWDAQRKTSIQGSDGIAVLVFIQQNAVIAYVEHSRGKGDFATVASQCFVRQKAKFLRASDSARKMDGLYPKPEG